MPGAEGVHMDCSP